MVSSPASELTQISRHRLEPAGALAHPCAVTARVGAGRRAGVARGAAEAHFACFIAERAQFDMRIDDRHGVVLGYS